MKNQYKLELQSIIDNDSSDNDSNTKKYKKLKSNNGTSYNSSNDSNDDYDYSIKKTKKGSQPVAEYDYTIKKTKKGKQSVDYDSKHNFNTKKYKELRTTVNYDSDDIINLNKGQKIDLDDIVYSKTYSKQSVSSIFLFKSNGKKFKFTTKPFITEINMLFPKTYLERYNILNENIPILFTSSANMNKDFYEPFEILDNFFQKKFDNKKCKYHSMCLKYNTEYGKNNDDIDDIKPNGSKFNNRIKPRLY